MKLGLLSEKNPSYDADLWCRYDALYRGGKDFRRHVDKFLTRNPTEPAEVYAQRKAESYYRSYVGPIVDYFAAQLMAAPMTVRVTDGESDETTEPDEFYSRFKEDVDGLGTDLVDFSRNAFRTALIKQRCWILASLPSDDGVAPATRADWEDRELGRVCLHHIEPEVVIDWECNPDGSLAWAILFEKLSPRGTPLNSRTAYTLRFRIVDHERVVTYERLYENNAHESPDDVFQEVGNELHGFTRVPLVRVETPPGLWLLNRVADAQTEHFRLSSGLGWAIRRTCYAMPVFKLKDGSVPTMGAGYYIQVGVEDGIEYAAPPAQPFDVIATEIKAQKDEIYRVAQQMAHGVDNNAAAVGRSAESKMADTSSTEVCLKAYGAVMREALEKVYDLVVNGRKDTIRVSVQGLDRFNLADAAIEVENTTKAMALAIPSPTFTKELYVKTAEALLPSLEQDKKDAIRSEIEKGVDEQAEAAKAAAESLQGDKQPDNESDESGPAAPGVKPPAAKETPDA